MARGDYSSASRSSRDEVGDLAGLQHDGFRAEEADRMRRDLSRMRRTSSARRSAPCAWLENLVDGVEATLDRLEEMLWPGRALRLVEQPRSSSESGAGRRTFALVP
jgi:hypothetical protein